jgi:dTDP-4-dehydrorhamnose reductase
LITGADGQVGWELRRTLAPLGEIVAHDRSTLDLADLTGLQAQVEAIAPDIIVNAAAYTAVDKAESDESAARRINAEAPRVLAEACAKRGALLVHYSTDYVFDGAKAGAYAEDDPTNPLGVYGRTKLAGERAIVAVTDRYFVFRTSWVYANRGRNFLLTMLRLGKERQQLRVVDDQRGAPTWARLIAEATSLVLARSLDISGVRHAGVYHMTCAGAASWREFAEEIFAQAKPDPCPRVVPITTADYPTPARRPLNSRLANDKLESTFGIRLPHWRDALALCMADR